MARFIETEKGNTKVPDTDFVQRYLQSSRDDNTLHSPFFATLASSRLCV